MHSNVRRLGVVLSVAFLSACGGGGGGGGGTVDPVALATEGDVVREIANVAALYIDDAEGSLGPTATSSSPRGARGVSARADRNRMSAKSTSPKIATVEDCATSGTSSYEYAEDVSRTLPLFDFTGQFDAYVGIDDNCTEVEGDYTTVRNGFYSFGDNDFYAESEGAPFYDYKVFGDDGEPQTHSFTGPSSSQTYSIIGRFEGQQLGSVYEGRERMKVQFDLSSEGQSVSMYVSIGEDGNPFTITENQEGDTFALNGVVEYGSTFCEGGRVVYETLVPLTFFYDEGTGDTYVNGGQISISAGSHTVTATFLENGDVSYSIDGGAPGVIARTALDETGDSCGLLFGSPEL